MAAPAAKATKLNPAAPTADPTTSVPAASAASPLTFLSLVFWTFVIGPLGALLAVPLSLFVKALLVDADPNSRWLDPLIAAGRHGDGDGPGREG
jgi:hypothetical protein